MMELVLLLSLVAVTPGPDSCLAALPLRPGWAWSYAGSALWSSGGGTQADSAAVSWTMTIVGARDAGSTRIALVRGFVNQLAWYEPSTRPRLSLLACRGPQLFGLEPASDSAAQSAYAHWSDSLLLKAEVLLDLPLHDGQLFGQNPPRNDPLYGWSVAAIRPGALRPLPASCGHSVAHRFELTYRSLPDHSVIEWQPGLGRTRYTYGHHGTPAATEVHLTSCRRPAS
jgi:hypothetical protein